MRIIVIGAGHAGIEAGYAAARMGADVVLVTANMESIAQMSCNPSIGGIAKGHLVKEIDACGGVMPRAADFTGLHFKTLNRSKGPAVRATRTQNDKAGYRAFMKSFLEKIPNLKLFQGIATRIRVKKGRVAGVDLLDGETLTADAVVITPGTFLNGRIFIGRTVYPAGRANEPASTHLAENIAALGFTTSRLKTGTPMRLHASTIDWSRFQPQPGDEPPQPFSIHTRYRVKNRVLCHLGYTSAEVKKIVQDHIHLSPLYSGKIKGIGPRYCPSIEDKIIKFADKERHHFFLEPEGLSSQEIYVNGLSSSLPVRVQQKILQAIPGLDRAEMTRPAYAVEYDIIDPTQLTFGLETKNIANLFFAGQVNGTSGYEEAAAQGLMAGINAVLKLAGRAPFIVARHQGYIGVLIDDLVGRGVDEPYRLFTSRAEYRLQLREDNAFERLGPAAWKLGLLSRSIYDRQMRILAGRKEVIEKLKRIKIRHREETVPLFQLLKMPEMNIETVAKLCADPRLLDRPLSDLSYIEANVKYEGYIAIQEKEVARMAKMARITLPLDLDYFHIDGLSTEVRQKLSRLKPATMREAAAIPGVTPASLNAIGIYLSLKYHAGKITDMKSSCQIDKK